MNSLICFRSFNVECNIGRSIVHYNCSSLLVFNLFVYNRMHLLSNNVIVTVQHLTNFRSKRSSLLSESLDSLVTYWQRILQFVHHLLHHKFFKCYSIKICTLDILQCYISLKYYVILQSCIIKSNICHWHNNFRFSNHIEYEISCL